MSLLHLARVVDHQMRLQIDLQTPSRKESCVRFAHHVDPEDAGIMLPVVGAGDAGTKCKTLCRNSAHRYDSTLTKADSSSGAGQGCPIYFVNSWALGWSRDP